MIYECNSCQSRFHDIAQNRSQQRDGICPSCGAEDITDWRDALSERICELSGRDAKDMLAFVSGRLDTNPKFWEAVDIFLLDRTPVIDLSECTGTEAGQKLAQAVLVQELDQARVKLEEICSAG